MNQTLSISVMTPGTLWIRQILGHTFVYIILDTTPAGSLRVLRRQTDGTLHCLYFTPPKYVEELQVSEGFKKIA